MTRKQMLSIELSATDRKGLQAVADADAKLPSETVRAGIHAVTEQPALYAKAVASLIERPLPEPSPRLSTTFCVEPSDVKGLDRIAKALAASRNAVVQTIIRGIINGVIR